MRPDMVRVSALPAGWSACRARGRRRAVIAWGVFADDGGLSTVGLVSRGGSSLVRGDRLPAFTGWAAGPGCEPQPDPPALAPADLAGAMADALAVEVGGWSEYEARIRENLTSAAATEWAGAALAGFEAHPQRWFRLWLRAAKDREATERDLMLRLRALSLVAPGRSLDEALADAGITLGGLLSADSPAGNEGEKT